MTADLTPAIDLQAVAQLRVVVVTDHRRGRVHGITTDQAEAQQWARDLVAKYDGDNRAATMTVGLVDASRLLAERDATIAELERQRDEATEFTINAYPDPDSVNACHFEIKVRWRGPGRWAVMHRGFCLGTDGTWDYETIPSERADDWKAAHRFDRDAALRLAREQAPHLTCNGLSIAGMVAWESERRAHGPATGAGGGPS